jgi:hypothetical protein
VLGVFSRAYILHSLFPFSNAVERIALPQRVETDSLGKVEVLSDKLWGAQTQRLLAHLGVA